jgi:hypothetical protein
MLKNIIGEPPQSLATHFGLKCLNSGLFNEFVCKLGFFWHEWASLKCVLKAPNRLKFLKLA